MFASAHYAEQGIAGVIQSLFTGFMFGIMYATTRQLWAAIAAHAAYDVVAVLMIYWNLETSVSHWLFR